MFTLAICTIVNGYTQVNIKILLIQSNHTTCVSFSCEFNINNFKHSDNKGAASLFSHMQNLKASFLITRLIL